MQTTLEQLDTTVQELRLEAHHGAFIEKLARVVTALGAIPDLAPGDVAADDIVRLRQLAEETIDAVERRIDSAGENNKVQQQLAGTIYEIRRRMEAVETWFHHFTS
jgi:hypothetical protein